MPVTINAQDVLDQVAFRLHLPAFGSGEFITPGDALALLNSSARRLSGLMSRLYGDDYFASAVTLSTQAEIDILSLPSDFHTLMSVHWLHSNATYGAIELERADVREFGSSAVSWDTCSLPRYRLEGASVLVFTPTPNAVYDVRIAYNSVGVQFEDASDSFQGLMGHDEWLICDMCQRIREREQKPADEFIRDRLELEGHMKEQASQRDRNATVQARDATGALNCSRRQLSRYARGWRY
jgi:hypothetical protein